MVSDWPLLTSCLHVCNLHDLSKLSISWPSHWTSKNTSAWPHYCPLIDLCVISVLPLCSLHGLSELFLCSPIVTLKYTSDLLIIVLWLTSAWSLFYLCAACTASLRCPLADLHINTLKYKSDLPIIGLWLTSAWPLMYLFAACTTSLMCPLADLHIDATV